MKLRGIRFLSLFLLAGLLWACGKKENEKIKTVDTKVSTARYPLPPAGVLIPQQRFGSDSTRNYALYLPPQFDSTLEWPVVLFFDPHAAGSLPLEKYKDAAAKYGFILAGSNYSRNRQDYAVGDSEYETILRDLRSRLKIKPKGIITAGFSGGGKVAIYLANMHPEISGVITCSGPESILDQTVRPDFSLYSIAGFVDFNFGVTKNFQFEISSYPFDKYFAYHDMIHEWPTGEQMEDAFLWMNMKLAREGVIQRDDQFIDSIYKDWEKNYLSKKKPVDQYDALHKLIAFFQGLKMEVYQYKSADSSLAYHPEVLKREKETIDAINFENQTYQNYTEGLDTWTKAEWQKEIGRIRSIADQKPRTPMIDAHRRIIAMLGMNCYSKCTQAVEESAFAEAYKLLVLYETVEPKNPEHRYLAARLEARQHHKEKALEELQRAVALGFKDLNRLDIEADFMEINKNPVFQELRARMQK